MEILKSLHEKGRTIVLVTHETQTAEFANRIIRMKDGVVESDKEIKEHRLHGPLK
jgi:ABC-type lipoprotein export system ATPase subunit